MELHLGHRATKRTFFIGISLNHQTSGLIRHKPPALKERVNNPLFIAGYRASTSCLIVKRGEGCESAGNWDYSCNADPRASPIGRQRIAEHALSKDLSGTFLQIRQAWMPKPDHVRNCGGA